MKSAEKRDKNSWPYNANINNKLNPETKKKKLITNNSIVEVSKNIFNNLILLKQIKTSKTKSKKR
jgi:hypothetical protein